MLRHLFLTPFPRAISALAVSAALLISVTAQVPVPRPATPPSIPLPAGPSATPAPAAPTGTPVTPAASSDLTPVPAAGAAPAAPAGRARSSAPIPFTPGDLEKLQDPILFPNTDVKDILEQYGKQTGKRLIYSTQLVGNASIVVNERLPLSEWIKIIELSLAMNGFFIEPVDGEPNIMRVTGPGAGPKQVGVPFIDSEAALANLPITEQVIMYLVRLQNADATEMATNVTSMLSQNPLGGYSSVVALPKANALLITENIAFVRNILQFIKKVDVEPAEVESIFIKLEYANAEDVVANLEKVFEKTQTPTAAVAVQPRITRGNGQQGQTGGGGPGAAIGGAPTAVSAESVSFAFDGGAGPTEDNIIIGKVKIVADKRTNRIHVVSRPVNLKFIKALIKEYDADVPLPAPAVRALRYRRVDEVLDAVVQAIQDPGDRAGATGGAGGSALGTNQGGRTTQNNTNQFNTNQNRNNQSSFNSGAGGDSSAGALGESLSTQEIPTTPIAQQVGKSTIIADPYSNTIVVIGTNDVKEKVMTLLEKLDSRQAQVMIEVIIGELRLTKDLQYGIDVILRNATALNGTNNPITGTGGTATGGIVGFNDLGSPVLNLNGLLNQQAVKNIATAGGSGFSGYFAAADAFNAVVNLLKSTNNFKVVTSPRVFTSNNKRAIITSGEEVPVPTNIQSGFNGGTETTNSSIQFKPIELRLEVLPLINSDREVSLEIVQNVSERAGSTIIDGNAIPNVSRRAIKTYVTVPNNGTLILGGLIKESNDNTKSGIPILVDIPWIGPLFGKTVKNKTRSELIVIMRPVVTMGPAETATLREKTFEKFAIPPDFDQALDPVGYRGEAVRPKILSTPLLPRGSAPLLLRESPDITPSRRR